MGDLGSAGNTERWVCPNDRQLALRAKLGTGWSIHTSKPSTSARRGDALTLEEQEQIMKVVQRAEQLETMEMERVGKLVDRLENMKKHALGNGNTQCVLCGEEFGLLASSSTTCQDCSKTVCSKCSVDTRASHGSSVWLCKLCSEHRELWKKSGAWFFHALPKYTLPAARKTDGTGERGQKRVPGDSRHTSSTLTSQVTSQSKAYSSSWSKSAAKGNDRHVAPIHPTSNADDQETTSSDDDLALSQQQRRAKPRHPPPASTPAPSDSDH